MTARRPALLVGAAVLGFLSIFLAWNRIYQVDEAQSVAMARIIATHQTSSFFTSTPLYLLILAPLSLISNSSVDLFHAFRLVAVVLFWTNVLLLVGATGARLRSREGIVTLAFVATLAPLWTYGLEVRHDNVQLCGLLLIWILMRPRDRPFPGAYFLIGLIAVGLQLSLFKAFAYWVPLTVAALALPHRAFRLSRALLVIQWAAGAATAYAVYYLLQNAWRIEAPAPVVGALSASVTAARTAVRFSPWPTLARLPVQTPILVIAGLGALTVAARHFARNGWKDESARGMYGAAALLAGALGVLFVNPTPFPYNLLLVVPPAVIAASAAYRQELLDFWDRGGRQLVGGLIVVHLVAFGGQIATLLKVDNDRQQELMRLAEYLTDPMRDEVFDLAGLVPTRRSISYMWFVNLTNFQAFQNDPALSENPPAVVIPNYRVGYLSDNQRKLLKSNYRPLANDFLVLGSDLPPGGGTWICRHPGRYVLGAKGNHNSLRINGVPATPGVRVFEAGSHRIEADTSSAPFVSWVGPSAESIEVDPGQMARVFPLPGNF